MLVGGGGGGTYFLSFPLLYNFLVFFKTLGISTKFLKNYSVYFNFSQNIKKNKKP